MEETNVTMTAEEMQGEPAAKENETKAEKFIRIGEYRMNKADDQRLHRHLDLCQYFGHKKLNFSPSITYAERIIS